MWGFYSVAVEFHFPRSKINFALITLFRLQSPPRNAQSSLLGECWGSKCQEKRIKGHFFTFFFTNNKSDKSQLIKQFLYFLSICDEDSIVVMMSCLSKGVGGGKAGSGNHDVRECSSPSPGTPWQSLNPYLLKHVLVFQTLCALKCPHLSENILGWYKRKRNSRDPNLFLRCCQEKLATYHLAIGPRICCLSHNLSSFATSLEHYFWCPNRYQTHFFTTSQKKRFTHTLLAGGSLWRV